MTTPVDAKQLALATNALLAFIHGEAEAKHNLLDDDGFISLVVTLARTPEKARTKPFYAPLAHSLYKDRPVCLITCDGLYKTVKENLKTNPVEGIEKVISLTKLRKEFSRYEDKRKLSNSYDLFLADARLLHLLPKLIGAKFFDKKKHPSIIDLNKADVIPSLVKARDATYFHLRAGPTLMIKIARTGFSDKQIIENFNTAIGAIVEQIPKKWKGVQALYLRTATSVALPFYNSLPFSLKIQDSDTPQLTLKGKRKADSDEKDTSSKKRALTSSLPSSAPFSTLTITGIKPEAEETLEEEDSDSPASPEKPTPQVKRKSIVAATPRAVAATTPARPVSTKKKQKVGVTPKAAPATPVAQPAVVATPASKPVSQKKKVGATPKAAPVTPVAPSVVPATPKPASQKKKAVGVTPKIVPAQPVALATPLAAPKSSLKKKVATPKVTAATPAAKPSTIKKKALAAKGQIQ